MSIQSGGGVSTFTYFILYIVSQWDQTDDIHLSGLSTSEVSTEWGLTVVHVMHWTIISKDEWMDERHGCACQYNCTFLPSLAILWAAVAVCFHVVHLSVRTCVWRCTSLCRVICIAPPAGRPRHITKQSSVCFPSSRMKAFLTGLPSTSSYMKLLHLCLHFSSVKCCSVIQLRLCHQLLVLVMWSCCIVDVSVRSSQKCQLPYSC